MVEQEGRIAPPPVLSQSRLSRSLAILAQLAAQALGLLLAAGNDRHGIVAGDAAEHIIASMAAPAASARPGSVLSSTTMPAQSTLTLHSFKISCKRLVLSIWSALPETA